MRNTPKIIIIVLECRYFSVLKYSEPVLGSYPQGAVLVHAQAPDVIHSVANRRLPACSYLHKPVAFRAYPERLALAFEDAVYLASGSAENILHFA